MISVWKYDNCCAFVVWASVLFSLGDVLERTSGVGTSWTVLCRCIPTTHLSWTYSRICTWALLALADTSPAARRCTGGAPEQRKMFGEQQTLNRGATLGCCLTSESLAAVSLQASVRLKFPAQPVRKGTWHLKLLPHKHMLKSVTDPIWQESRGGWWRDVHSNPREWPVSNTAFALHFWISFAFFSQTRNWWS